MKNRGNIQLLKKLGRGPTKKHSTKFLMIPKKIGIATRFFTNLVGVDKK